MTSFGFAKHYKTYWAYTITEAQKHWWCPQRWTFCFTIGCKIVLIAQLSFKVVLTWVWRQLLPLSRSSILCFCLLVCVYFHTVPCQVKSFHTVSISLARSPLFPLLANKNIYTKAPITWLGMTATAERGWSELKEVVVDVCYFNKRKRRVTSQSLASLQTIDVLR